MKLFAKLCYLLLLLPCAAAAELPDNLKTDFAPADGLVIMQSGDDYLVTLDAASNLREGDILTLVSAGEQIIHPVTKEVIGTLEIPTGYLQVTWIKSGYSHARPLSEDLAPQRGDRVKRFEQVPATFSATPHSEQLFIELKKQLPQLNWQMTNNVTQPLLTFSLSNNLLTVTSVGDVALHSYQLAGFQQTPPPATPQLQSQPVAASVPIPTKPAPVAAANSLIETAGSSSLPGQPGATGIIRAQPTRMQQGLWESAPLEGTPIGLAAADFDNDGQQELALAFEHHVAIVRISQDKMQDVATIKLPTGTLALTLDSIDLDGNGTTELYLSAAKNRELSSVSIEYRAGGYQISNTNIPWFLRVLELPVGRVLVGQRIMDIDDPLASSPFAIRKNGAELLAGDPIALPGDCTLFSYLPGISDSDQPVTACLSQGDKLMVVDADNTEIWESGDDYGGTESLYSMARKGNSRELLDPIYIQKRILRGPSGTTLVARNEGVRALKRYRSFNNSQIVALTWDGMTMTEAWRTAAQKGYLADFTLADSDNDGADELSMIIRIKKKSLLQKDKSKVVIYELN